jgi:DNA-binding transcriptional LysR family regulator
MMLEQKLVALLPEGHPLAAKRVLRLSDCTRYPVALAARGFGGRELLDEFCARSGLSFRVAAESNSFELLRGLVRHGDAISFQIQIGAPPDGGKLGIVVRDIDNRDAPRANLVLGQLRGRTLAVSAALFAQRLARSLEELRPAA